MSKWDYLVEGGALKPTPQMRAQVRHLVDRVGEVFEANISRRKGRIVYRAIAKALNSNNSLTNVIVDGGEYGSYRVRLTWSLSGFLLKTGGMGGTAPTDEELFLDDPGLPEFLKQGLRQRQAAQSHAILKHVYEPLSKHAGEFDYTVDVKLGVKELLSLNIPIIGRFLKKKKIAGLAKIKDTLFHILLHEFVHVIDPKTKPAFVREQRAYRTRSKGYSLANMAQAMSDPAAYIKSELESETWPRDMAKLIIVAAWAKRNNVKDVELAIRNPGLVDLTNHPQANLPNYMKGGTINVIDVMRSKPTLWRRFLKTLVNEGDVFFENPELYIGYSSPASAAEHAETKKNRESFSRWHDRGQRFTKWLKNRK